MNLTKYKSLIEAINALDLRGYELSLKYKNGLLRDRSEPSSSFNQKQLVIREYHRFSESDRDVMLFALETSSGEKGQILTSSNDENMFEIIHFMDKVKIKPSAQPIASKKQSGN